MNLWNGGSVMSGISWQKDQVAYIKRLETVIRVEKQTVEKYRRQNKLLREELKKVKKKLREEKNDK